MKVFRLENHPGVNKDPGLGENKCQLNELKTKALKIPLYVDMYNYFYYSGQRSFSRRLAVAIFISFEKAGGIHREIVPGEERTIGLL